MRLKKIMAIISCAFMLGTGLPLPARAALIGTEQLLRNDSSERVRISSFLARAEVRRELLARGVDPADLPGRLAYAPTADCLGVCKTPVLPTGGSHGSGG